MLGEKIKAYRESKKMTQKDIAEILEVEPGTISKYESGIIEPNIESIKRLAETFGITIDELLKDEDEKFDISKIDILECLKEQKEMGLKGNLYHNTQVIFAYNTNHIEGSKLTEDQTRYIFETNTILFEGQTVASVDDILETANHFKLVDYMLEGADKKLSEEMIKKFHKILKEGTSDSRKEWFNVRSEKIHPFQDGNGRVGRIIAFKECLKNNIVPFIILDKDKLFYYRGLKEYKNEKGFLIDTCLNAQDQYTNMIEYYLK